MSGIFGVWHKAHDDRVAATLAAITAGLPASTTDGSARESAGSGGVGVQMVSSAVEIFRNDRVLLSCDADLLNEDELGGVAARDERGRASIARLLAHAYEQHGLGLFDRLRGGFSLVLWDLTERRLVAGVDGFGIKRLAWYEDGDVVAVASRADSLRNVAAGPSINPRAIANVLNFSANLAPETIFRGVHRLQPGEILTAGTRGTSLTSYWNLRYDAKANAGEPHLRRELESVVERSVAMHCGRKAVSSLGAFLSGGTDSSTVVGLMTRVTGTPIKAYSIGFKEEGFSELSYAEIAAKRFGAEHHTYLVSAADCVGSLPAIVRSFDEPFGNSSAIATYFCARLAAEHGTSTLLAGDGGDELFGGNERYAVDKIFETYHSLPVALRKRLIEPLVRLPIDIGLARRARGYVRRANMRGIERMLSFQFLQTHSPADVFDPDFLGALGDYTVLDIPARHYAQAPAREHLDRLLYVDMKITLADNDLPKVTTASELAGVRTRFPFLERTVAEFSGGLPTQLKVKGLKKRYLFKRAFRELLPPDIIQKKKHGFGVPVALWMKSDPRMRELTYDILRSGRARERGYFRRTFLDQLFRHHESGDDTFYGDTIWTFLMLELWLREVVDQPVRVTA